MRIPRKLFLILALAALASLSCQLVTGPRQNDGPVPDFHYDTDRGPLVFQPDQLPEAQVGKDYTARVTVEDAETPVGEWILQEGELPPGLELAEVQGEENTAEISGTPSEAGTYAFVIYVWCYGTQVSGQEGEKEYTIVVK